MYITILMENVVTGLVLIILSFTVIMPSWAYALLGIYGMYKLFSSYVMFKEL